MTPSSPAVSFGLLGISHRTAPLDLLERLALTGDEIGAAYQELGRHDAIRDAMILSTCNRTEIYALAPTEVDVAGTLGEVLGNVTGTARFPDAERLYASRGDESVRHLFRVACGLDSMILGEAQILGQMKAAFERSREHRPPSAYFEQVVQAAFKVARHSRAATEIGRGAVSVASAGVQLATRVFSDLSRRTVAVVGAGDTGRLAAEHFAKHTPKRLWILNRTLARAEGVAQALRGEAMTLAALDAAVAEADIVACAVSTTTPIIDRALVEAAMISRSGRPLALLDLGLPRNVDAGAGDIANVFLHDIEALERVVDGNLSHRRGEVRKVEGLIESEIDRLLARRRVLAAGPLIAALRASVEGARRAEVARATGKLSPAEAEAVDRVTRAVINKLLHGPTTSIKEVARQQDEGHERLELIRRMFGGSLLEEDESPEGSPAMTPRREG